MKNGEVNNKQKNKYGKLKTILSIWHFKRKRLLDGILTKQRFRICAHGGMHQWGVNYWETYTPLVNWIIVRSLLAIASIHELTSRSIDFVIYFNQDDLDGDVFMDLPLVMGVYKNRR